MRAVVHLAADANYASVRLARERFNHRAGARDLRVWWGEDLVDDGHLRRMNRHFAGKAIAARGLAFTAESHLVTEVRIDGVDRLNARGVGGEQREIAGQHVRRRVG